MAIFLFTTGLVGLATGIIELYSIWRELHPREERPTKEEFAREVEAMRQAGWEVRLTKDGTGMFAQYVGGVDDESGRRTGRI